MFRQLLQVTLIIALIFATVSTAAVPGEFEERAQIVSQDASALALEFNLNEMETEPVFIDGKDVKAFRIAGEGATLDPGKPILPMVSRFIVVPPDAGLRLEVEIGNRYTETADFPPKLFDGKEIMVGPQNLDMGVTSIYPPVAAEMSEPFIIRGVRLVKVTTYPIQYDPVENVYIHNEQINAQVRYTDDEPVNPVRIHRRTHRSPDFLKMMDMMAINGDIVGRDDPDFGQERPYAGHYCIVTHENCEDLAEEFIQWRRKSGYKIDVIVANNPGSSNTTKNQIQNLYDSYLDRGEDPFDYILLIGDISRYDNGVGNAQWVLETYPGRSCWGTNINHADYVYACLEGGNNDQHPDVGIGRWASGSRDQMGLAVGRTMQYIARPPMDDNEWMERGAVYSQHWGNSAQSAWHITIHTNVRWAEEVLQYRGYDDIHFYERYDWDRNGDVIGPWVRDLFNEGAAIFLGRAENYYWRRGFQGVQDNDRFPVRIVASGHGEWPAWSMWRGHPNGSADNLKGPVNTTFGWGGPPTAIWSAVWMETVRSTMLNDLPLGWSYAYAIQAVERYFPNVNGWMGRTSYYECVKTDFNHYGDPGIQPWFGTPRMVNVEHPRDITASTRMIPVHVTDDDDDSDVEGARVTFWVPESDYMITMFTDENGIANFVMDEDADIDGNEAHITVTGRDIRPYTAEIDVENSMSAPELIAYELEEIDGNGNADVNPGESFNLSLTTRNLGNRDDLPGLTAVVSSLSPWVTVEDNEISFGDLPAGEDAEGDAPVAIEIHESCPDGSSRPGTRPVLQVEFNSGNNTYISAIKLNPEAPNFIIRNIVGGTQIDVGRQNLDLDIENIGSFNSAAVTGMLVTQGIGVSVVEGEANYPAINAGSHSRTQGGAFSVSGNSIAVPGSRHDLILVLRSAAGFMDTAYFELQVDEVRRNAPQGPDPYGYICFDDTDEDWDIAPDYDWVEINPDDRDAEFDGREIDFSGNSQFDIGESDVVQMGMETQFYGHIYDRVTVGTNGFVAMGDQRRITNFQNWPMDRAMGGGVGMLAPFWDNLDYTNNSKVLYYHDREDNRFIIEWYRMRHRHGGNEDLTFQVILYDRDVWITETGDQNILFQYKDISNVQGQREGQEREKNNYYASVGISGPQGYGLSYTWDDEYPINCAELQDRRAIIYATSARFKSGVLFGRVTDAANGQPVEGATVVTEHGFTAMTDADGNYIVNDALAEVPFRITATMNAYNDSTYEDLEIAEDDTMEINFDLLHPEFVPSDELIEAELPVNERVDLNFTISNTGNGPLEYFATGQLIGDADSDPWELRRSYMVSDIADDSRVQGAIFVNDMFYVAGANDRSPMISVINRDGELVDQYRQPGPDGSYGIRDMAWDGEWIWGSGDEVIYAFTPEGEVMREFEGPWNPNHNFTWDMDDGLLWVCSTTSDIVAIDRDGNEVRELDRLGMRIYGLAYYPDDPDGYKLYIYHKENDIGDHILHKMNTQTGDTAFVKILDEELDPEILGRPSSAFATNTFDVYSWVFISVTNDGADDRIDIWQIDARRDWFALDPVQGVIDADEQQEFTVTFNATDLPPGIRFEAQYNFYHNAAAGDGEFTLPVALDVLGGVRTLDLSMEQGWNLISANVDPENRDVVDILQPLVDQGLVSLFKNGNGQFYLPEQDFNNIPEWDPAGGYQINLTEAVQFEMQGAPIESDTPIPLDEGWNMVGFYPRRPIEATVAVSGIVDVLDIAKDGAGSFYLPEFGFSNMGEMSEGKGYQMKLLEAVDLVYTDDMVEGAAIVRNKSPKHFPQVEPTDEYMPLLLSGNSTMKDWEIAACNSDGQIVGSGIIDADGRCGLAAWGDDISTETIDGLARDEAISFKLWNGVEEIAIDVDPVKGEMKWDSDSYLAGDIVFKASAPVTFGIHESYPNPANGPVRIMFGLPDAANAMVKVYDLAGREVANLVNGNLTAGYHTVTWNTDLVSSGVYIIQVAAMGQAQVTKVAVVK